MACYDGEIVQHLTTRLVENPKNIALLKQHPHYCEPFYDYDNGKI